MEDTNQTEDTMIDLTGNPNRDKQIATRHAMRHGIRFYEATQFASWVVRSGQMNLDAALLAWRDGEGQREQ